MLPRATLYNDRQVLDQLPQLKSLWETFKQAVPAQRRRLCSAVEYHAALFQFCVSAAGHQYRQARHWPPGIWTACWILCAGAGAMRGSHRLAFLFLLPS